jgi:hypothetical protein
MSQSTEISEYRDAGCIFRLNRATKVLQIIGTQLAARPVVLRLRREGWFPKDLRAIWFSGDPAVLLVGPHLTIYIATRPPVTVKPSPNFKDIVNSL